MVSLVLYFSYCLVRLLTELNLLFFSLSLFLFNFCFCIFTLTSPSVLLLKISIVFFPCNHIFSFFDLIRLNYIRLEK